MCSFSFFQVFLVSKQPIIDFSQIAGGTNAANAANAAG